MLSTSDNPYNPYTDYDDWFAFDSMMKYNTNGYLARLIITSNDISEPDQELAIENTIDEIVKENVSGLYIKVEQP